MNYIETLEKADVNIATVGDNTVIAAPGDGKYIMIDFIMLVFSGNTSLQMKDGATNYGGPLPMYAGGAMAVENAFLNEHGVITLSNNSAFVLNLSTAVQVGGFIRYRIFNK